jgi:isoquinoline 1-oxidoreductase beta subunit
MKGTSLATGSAISVPRRNFLRITAASAIGGLTLAFGLPARGEGVDSPSTDAQFTPNPFLRIDRAGKVTFVMPVIEMGQGTYTSLPMLIAEELEVDVDKVTIEHSPPDDEIYANPLVGLQLTGGSTSIRGTYIPLRRAGAAARVMLVNAAARRWDVAPSSCQAERGAVVHRATGRRLGYGELVDAAASCTCPKMSR